MTGWNESAWFAVWVNAALKGTAVLGAASGMAFLLRRRSAAVRHLVWTAALAALLALPFLAVSLPGLRVPTGAWSAWAPSITFHAGTVASADNPTAPAGHSGATGPAADFAPWRPDPRVALLLVAAAGALLMIIQMLYSYALMWRVRRAARLYPHADHWRGLAQALGITHPVDVREIESGSVPMTFGLWRSTVLLPSGAEHWSEERLRVVMLHELAHVRRGDCATHLLARVALSLFWWNPLAWTAWRRFLHEGERAADDLVLTAGEPATEYAGHLLEVARSLQTGPAAAWIAVGMARRSQLEGRLLAILDSGVNRQAPGRASAWAVALLAAVLLAPFAALRAQDPREAVVAPDVDATILAANTQKNHEILDRAASAYTTLRQYEAAQRLLESALTVRAETSGVRSPVYAAGLLKLGDLSARRGQVKDALDFYSRAVDLGDTPETAAALIYLGSHAANVKDYPRAQTLIQRALSVDSLGPQAARAMTWNGRIAAAQGFSGLAESYLLQAVAMAHHDTADAAYAMDTYAAFLADQSRTAESNDMKARAMAVHRELIDQMIRSRRDAAAAFRVGGPVSAPVLLQKAEPEYSEDARMAKLQGSVTLYVQIGTDGQAYNVKVMHGIGFGLDEKAVEAVQLWKFQPGTRGGQPVVTEATIEVNFRLL